MRGVDVESDHGSRDEELLRGESPRPIPEGEAEGLDRVVDGLVEGDEPAPGLDEGAESRGAGLAEPARVLLRHGLRQVPVRDPARGLRGEEDGVEAGQVAAPHVRVPHVLPLEAVLVQHPARPALGHRGLPRTVDRDARRSCFGQGAGGGLGGDPGERESVVGGERARLIGGQVRQPVRPGGHLAVRRREHLHGAEALLRQPAVDRVGVAVQSEPGRSLAAHLADVGRDFAPFARRHVERFVHVHRIQSHLEAEFVARHVVRRLRRSAGILAPVGVFLGLHQVDHVRPEGLGRNHVRPGGEVEIALRSGYRERFRRAQEFDPGPRHQTHEFDDRPGVVRGPGIEHVGERPALRRVSALDLAPAHEVVVEEVLFLELRAHVRHGLRGGHHVVHGVAQVPAAAEPRVVVVRRRRLRGQVPGARAERVRNLVLVVAAGRRVPRARRLRQEPEHVVIVGSASHRPVPPQVEDDAAVDARLPLLVEAPPHRMSHLVQGTHDERIEVRVHGVLEGRHPDPPGEGARLMLIIDDLREPVVIELPRHRLRLDLRQHVPVAIVVVPDIVMIELRDARHLELAAHIRHIPVGDDIQAVRVHVRHQEDDRVLPHTPGLRGLVRHEVARHLRHQLPVRDLRRVQPAVDPHDRDAFPRERPRLLLGENRPVAFVRIAGVGERPRDLLDPFQAPEIRWR